MAKSTIIALTTFGSIAVAAIISIVWFWVSDSESRFEPAVGILGLLGGLFGILAERRAATHERRRTAMTSLADELGRAKEVLSDGCWPASGSDHRPRVYPRLPISAVDAALVSGALTEPGDADLVGRLHQWRDEANGFNRRLDLTEIRVLVVGAAHETPDFDRALNGYLDQVRSGLADLRQVVAAIIDATTPQRSRLFSRRPQPQVPQT